MNVPRFVVTIHHPETSNTYPSEDVVAMATDSASNVSLDRMSADDITGTVSTIKKMVMVGMVFAVVGYLLVGSALVLEFTEFHPAIDSYVEQNTEHSLAGGGPDRAGQAQLNNQLAELNKYPSLLLWLKLGGIAHILFGIFFVLAAIVRALSMMPHRLGYEMERT